MSQEKIAIIGGTGGLGQGLAYRFSDAGFEVLVGSREASKAEASAAEMLKEKPTRKASGHDNVSAAKAADVVILTVPFANQKSTLETIKQAVAGKIVIDATVCLAPPKVGKVQIPAEGSAGMIAQATIGDVAKLVSAFQNAPATGLQSGKPLHCDILVTGNDKESCIAVTKLIEAIGMRGFYAGPIENSIATEAMTSVLITINRQFKCHAGIELTNLEHAE